MLIAVKALAAWLSGHPMGSTRERPVAPPAPAPETPAPTPHCYEVLIPYYHPREAAKQGLSPDARLTMIVRVWALDVAGALACAHERFLDHRRLHGRSARMAPEGPVPLRIAREVEEATALPAC